ncbi:MAG TPA: protealysin inhibitor emfourin [Planctomycetota bacterium]|nr:protealysin inhibitor emfourin [Planctomycetota bacterium]
MSRIERVLFRQSGGFSGQIRGCDVGAGEIGEDVRALVEHAAQHPVDHRDVAARDAEVYELCIERDGEPTYLRFDEASMTAQQAPLIEFLQSQARPQPLDDPRWRRVRLACVFFDLGDTLVRAHRRDGELELESMPGAVACLEAFSRAKVRRGVISNTPAGHDQARMMALLERCGLAPHLDQDLCVFSSVVGCDKSSTKIFDLAATRAGLRDSTARLLFVGEDAAERRMAQAAGWMIAADIDAARELLD